MTQCCCYVIGRLQWYNRSCLKQINSVRTPMMNEFSELMHNISRIPLHENMLSFSIQTDIIRFHI